jgi:hypothetical protein
VKDMRKMIGKMIWDARVDAEFELNSDMVCQCPFYDLTERSDSCEQSRDEEEDDVDK